MRWLFLAFFFLNSAFVYAECNFRTADYIEGMASPKTIKSIDIEIPKSSKHVQNLLKIFISKSPNIPSKLKKSFKANFIITYDFGICRYPGKVRQNGDQKDHIKLVKGNLIQSLDVKLKSGNILNAVEFKLLIPETRNGLNEIFASITLRNLGFIAPETFEVNTSVNGKKATMLFQEKARKELLERNLRREGPIFRGDETLMWSYKNYSNIELDRLSLSTLYNKGWFKKGPSSQQIVLSAYEKLQNSSVKNRYHQEGIGSLSYLIPDLASEALYNDFTSILIAMNGYHGLHLNNRKHYYNAISGGFEPIYYDGDLNLTRDWEPPINKSYRFLKPLRLSDHLFQKVESLDDNSKLKDKFLKRVINEDQAHLFFNKALSKFKSNIQKIHLQNNSIEGFKKSMNAVSDSDYYSWYKDFQYSKRLSQKLITNIKLEDDTYFAAFDDQGDLALSEDEVLSVISKNTLHDQRVVYIPPKLNISDPRKTGIKDISISGIKIRMSNGMSVKYSLMEKRLVFNQTNPSDWALIHDSYISGWTLLLNGLVANSTIPPSEQRFNAQGLTGCLTLYNVELIDSSFLVTNGQCEDSLNFINTNGRKIAIGIHNSYADAVDADFSFLDIERLDVSNAGNDCFDVSGGKYVVAVSELKGCGDKGVSVGEKSYFEGSKIVIENALIGISAKDFSRVIVKSLNVDRVSICGESKRKKQEFGGGDLFIKETNCNETYSSDDESIIRVGG